MTRLLVSLILLCTAVSFLSFGCVKKTITDERIIAAVQAFLDAPPDPANENALTAEERAAIESFEVFKNTCKVQLVEGTPDNMWEQIGRKIVKVFAQANRDAGVLEVSYYVELYIMAEFENKKENFKVASIRLENASDRVYPELFSPTRRR